MPTSTKFPSVIGPTNIFQSECYQITDNIQKCITSDCIINTFSFQEKRQQFLLLNVHCERELRTLTNELTKQKKAIDYKIVYNTYKPYYIYYNKPQSKVIITQHSFL